MARAVCASAGALAAAAQLGARARPVADEELHGHANAARPLLLPSPRAPQVKYYDGNSVTVYPHSDLGQGGSDWWPSVESGWEKGAWELPVWWCWGSCGYR